MLKLPFQTRTKNVFSRQLEETKMLSYSNKTYLLKYGEKMAPKDTMLLKIQNGKSACCKRKGTWALLIPWEGT